MQKEKEKIDVFQCRSCKRHLGWNQLLVKDDPDEKHKTVFVCKICNGYVRLKSN